MNIKNRNDNKLVLVADLHVEVDRVAFTVKASEDSIIISVKNIFDGYALLRRVLLPFAKNKRLRRYFKKTLNQTNQTVYFQNRYLGLFGPKANPISKMLLP